MAINSEKLGLCSWNFWNFLFSMRLSNGEYFKVFKIFDLTWIWWIWLEWSICKMMISPGFTFSFFLNFDIWVVSGVRGQRMTQNNKRFCWLRTISQEPYIISLSFMVHMCKMIISQGFFSIFLNFFFLGQNGGSERAKNCPKRQKIMLCLVFQESYIIWYWSMVHICIRIISVGIFFNFSKFWFFRFLGE